MKTNGFPMFLQGLPYDCCMPAVLPVVLPGVWLLCACCVPPVCKLRSQRVPVVMPFVYPWHAHCNGCCAAPSFGPEVVGWLGSTLFPNGGLCL